MTLCQLCADETAPAERGVLICAGCTRLLLRFLENPHYGVAKVITPNGYGQSCGLCGEYRSRRMIVHPEWGRVCEVDVREAAEIHGL